MLTVSFYDSVLLVGDREVAVSFLSSLMIIIANVLEFILELELVLLSNAPHDSAGIRTLFGLGLKLRVTSAIVVNV